MATMTTYGYFWQIMATIGKFWQMVTFWYTALPPHFNQIFPNFLIQKEMALTISRMMLYVLFSVESSYMCFKVTILREGFFANIAHERFFTRVDSFVYHQSVSWYRRIFALITFQRVDAMFFCHMTSKRARFFSCKVTFCTLMWHACQTSFRMCNSGMQLQVICCDTC